MLRKLEIISLLVMSHFIGCAPISPTEEKPLSGEQISSPTDPIDLKTPLKGNEIRVTLIHSPDEASQLVTSANLIESPINTISVFQEVIPFSQEENQKFTVSHESKEIIGGWFVHKVFSADGETFFEGEPLLLNQNLETGQWDIPLRVLMSHGYFPEQVLSNQIQQLELHLNIKDFSDSFLHQIEFQLSTAIPDFVMRTRAQHDLAPPLEYETSLLTNSRETCPNQRFPIREFSLVDEIQNPYPQSFHLWVQFDQNSHANLRTTLYERYGEGSPFNSDFRFIENSFHSDAKFEIPTLEITRKTLRGELIDSRVVSTSDISRPWLVIETPSQSQVLLQWHVKPHPQTQIFTIATTHSPTRPARYKIMGTALSGALHREIQISRSEWNLESPFTIRDASPQELNLETSELCNQTQESSIYLETGIPLQSTEPFHIQGIPKSVCDWIVGDLFQNLLHS